MALTREEVLKIAKLAKLEFNEEEIEKFQVELNDILKYIDILDEVDTQNVEPLKYINHDVNNFREKENVESEFERLDADKNGTIDFEEFKKFVKEIINRMIFT